MVEAPDSDFIPLVKTSLKPRATETIINALPEWTLTTELITLEIVYTFG